MNTFVPEPNFEPQSLRGSILILPSISIANVPQLTIDLLVSTLDLSRVGFLDDPTVLPIAGANAYRADPEAKITTNLEVFISKDRSITLLQQRSPAAKGLGQQYVRNTLAWISAAGFSHVVLLSSADAARRVDSQMSSPFRFLATPSTPEYILRKLGNHGILPLEKVFSEEDIVEANENRDNTYLHMFPKIIGGGLTRRMLSAATAIEKQKIATEEGFPPMIALLKFSSEGDNVPDAVVTAERVLQICCLLAQPDSKECESTGKMDWKFPVSWRSLFGTFDPTNRVQMYQ